jgi:hypothetical protein
MRLISAVAVGYSPDMSNSTGLRIVVTVATGNVGTSGLQALGEERGVS